MCPRRGCRGSLGCASRLSSSACSSSSSFNPSPGTSTYCNSSAAPPPNEIGTNLVAPYLLLPTNSMVRFIGVRRVEGLEEFGASKFGGTLYIKTAQLICQPQPRTHTNSNPNFTPLTLIPQISSTYVLCRIEAPSIDLCCHSLFNSRAANAQA